MTHIRSREYPPPPTAGPSPTKVAWREHRLVAPVEVIELFDRVPTRRVEGRTGVRYDRVRPGRRSTPEAGEGGDPS
jgi:hypothetical protein